MSHPEQQQFVAWVRERHPQYFAGRRVLEVGSMNINGTVRGFFQGCHYVGIDLGPGPGVDEVCHATDFLGSVPSLEVVISCEALEHDRRWYDTLTHVQKLLCPGGLLLVTCAGPFRQEHGTHASGPECSPYTPDHYRNLCRGDIELLLHFPAVWDCTDQDTRFYMIKGLE